MYEIVSGSTHNLIDTASFIEQLDHLSNWLPDSRLPFFNPQHHLVVTRAPGRLDLMGGIADYSGSLVLELPIASATHVALQIQQEPIVRILSLPPIAEGLQRRFEMPLADFFSAGAPLEYVNACARFSNDTRNRWAAYIAGSFLVLMQEKGIGFNEGAHLLISSAIPEGAGVSSSAALEVASMQAVVAAYNVETKPHELALLCQKVENLVAGAPCGVMDQMTAACGEMDKLLLLLCQPDEVKGTVNLPEELEVWGIDSGIRHSVGGAGYGRVRSAAFMGYRIIAELAGLTCRQSETPGKVEIADEKWNGYLANIEPEEFELSYVARLPKMLSGERFLKDYQGITDAVTSVVPEENYPVLAATRHPIYEHARVRRFAETLVNWRGLSQAQLLGDLMFASHESYSACGLGSEGTDELVRLVRESGSASGLYGAKITGGGSGGTVAVLGRRGAQDAIYRIAEEYEEGGHQPTVITGSSPGAGRFGHLRLMQKPRGNQ